MRRIAAIWYLFLVVPLGGLASNCGGPPEAAVALSAPGGVTVDDRYLGVWCLIEDKSRSGYLTVQRVAGRRGLEILVVGALRAGGEQMWIRARGYPSRFDGRTYFNVRRIAGRGNDYTADGRKAGYILVRPTLAPNGSLFLDFMAEEAARTVGRREKSESGLFVTALYTYLPLSRPKLIEFIRRQSPDKLFTQRAGPLRRLRPGEKGCPPTRRLK